jgi:hypothetical protein
MKTGSRNRVHSLAGIAILATVTMLLAPQPAEAQRAVTVNGHWLSPPQIQQADRNAGYKLPNGHYWCDPSTGLWGAFGQRAWGRVHPSQCPPPAGSAGGNGYVRRGPGGNMGSDGGCSYYNDPQTGASVMTGNC